MAITPVSYGNGGYPPLPYEVKPPFLEKAREALAHTPFQALSDSMLFFVHSEKTRFFYTPTTRLAVDEAGEVITGYCFSNQNVEDAYHPKTFRPFDIQGFWIPEKEGELFSHEETGPLIRTRNGEREFLFLIHPKSEKRFAPIIKKYQDQRVVASALSLSSFRTLLVAIPHTNDFAMVKVSLDQNIENVSRILKRRELALSVANSFHLQKNPPSSVFAMKESFSFLPEGAPGGIIYREFSQSYFDNHKVFPLFALFGEDNQDLFQSLIQKNPTQFVCEDLLLPIANIFAEMLFTKNCSLQIHGQNLLVAIESNSLKFLYRDMGGVNLLLNDLEMAELPENLQNRDFFYFDNHVKDAAKILEDFSQDILFHLTKQFVKWDVQDPHFANWKSFMIREGFIQNFTGLERLPLNRFYRYGYFEKLFARILLEVLSQKGVLFEKHANYGTLLEEIEDPQTCAEREWFSDLVKTLKG